VAPGVDTYSTYPDNRYVELSGYFHGSSSHIRCCSTYYFPLLYALQGTAYSEYIRDYMTMQAVDLGDLGFDTLYGYGCSLLILTAASFKAVHRARGAFKSMLRKRIGNAPFLKDGERCFY
jgi:hypothetical protein